MKRIFLYSAILIPEAETLRLFSDETAVLQWQIMYIWMPLLVFCYLVHRRFQIPKVTSYAYLERKSNFGSRAVNTVLNSQMDNTRRVWPFLRRIRWW